MKRILLLLLVLTLSLSVLFGCDLLNKDDNQGTPNEDNNQTDGPSDETPDGGNEKPDGGDEVVDYLPDAVRYLHSVYKDAIKTTARDFDVIGQVDIDGIKFPVTWTCDNDKISIRPSVSDPTAYTVDLPSVNTEEFSYVLTATISDGKGNSEQRSYEFTVPVLAGVETELEEGVAYKLSFNQLKLGKRLFALNKSQNDQNKFILSTNDPKAAPDFFVEKVDGGYKIYTEINGVKNYVYAQLLLESGKTNPSKYVGFSTENGSVFTYDSIGAWYTLIDGSAYGLDAQAKYGFGTYGDYDTLCISEWSHFTASSVGTSQYIAEFITSEYAETLAPDEGIKVEEPADGSPLTIKEALDLGVKVPSYTTGKFYVTGKIIEIQNTTYGNIVIADDNGNSILIYGTYDATGANRFDAMANQPKVGDTVTVYGVVGNYNGTAQLKNAWITNIVPGEGGETHEHNYVDGKCSCGATDPNYTPGTSTIGIVSSPEVGVAYKFGLFHGNENATVFFTGENYNGYAWYLAYATTGIDVYLETVEGVDGAYRLFFYNGDAKTYVVAFPRDGDTTKGTLKLDTVVPSEYYTFNTEYNTLIYTSTTGEQFYLGSSGTYKSISLSAISYITSATSYVSHLYAEGAGGEEVPHEHNFVNGQCACGESDPSYVVPEDGVYTIPQVLAAAEGTSVIVKGTVSEIYQAWNSQYSNISFYIVDDAGNRLLVFRTGTNVEIGDQVTVTGTATLYNEVIQIAQGGVTVIDVKHTCSDFNAADCLNAATCKVCGKVNGTALGHSYVNGACSACGAAEVSGTVTASKIIADLITELGWTSSTTKQTFNLDDNVSVKINGGANTGKAYNGDHIRIYATDTPAGTITISVPDGYELVSVKVTTQTGTYAFLCVDGSDADISNTTTAVSGSSVVLNSVKNGSDGKQVRVMAIEVVYKAV